VRELGHVQQGLAVARGRHEPAEAQRAIEGAPAVLSADGVLVVWSGRARKGDEKVAQVLERRHDSADREVPP
jgi:hypothetical protein